MKERALEYRMDDYTCRFCSGLLYGVLRIPEVASILDDEERDESTLLGKAAELFFFV